MSGSFALALLLAYFFGAIPFGVIIGRARGVDVRSVGSGNIGATNVWRALGPVAGTTVFALDLAKGWAAAYCAALILHGSQWDIALCALMAVLGHMYSVFLKFKGGKGIATAFGAMLFLVPIVAMACFVCWGIVLACSRTISIASIAACCVTPIALVLCKSPPPYGLVVIFFAMIAILKHLPNIKRIIEGTEPKLGSKPKTQPETSPPTSRRDGGTATEL